MSAALTEARTFSREIGPISTLPSPDRSAPDSAIRSAIGAVEAQVLKFETQPPRIARRQGHVARARIDEEPDRNTVHLGVDDEMPAPPFTEDDLASIQHGTAGRHQFRNQPVPDCRRFVAVAVAQHQRDDQRQPYRETCQDFSWTDMPVCRDARDQEHQQGNAVNE